jgi:hypothetical protein
MPKTGFARESHDREAFVGSRKWAMSAELVPTFTSANLTARIHWRPVGVAAWEVVSEEGGLCSLPRFQHAGAAKEDAWAHLADLAPDPQV